ncbi:MAG: RcpC/CpaB family pilus assembly protein, partial [Methylococcales bacterium]
ENTNDVIRKIAAINFARGELSVSHRINVHLGGSALSALIKQGMRAINAHVNDEVGVAGFILRGNYVDVFSKVRLPRLIRRRRLRKARLLFYS